MDRPEIGRQLRARRLAAGLTQRELARRCGISQSHVAAYEAGTRAISEDQASRLHEALRPRPSIALRTHADEVRAIAERHGATSVRVFGSIARDQDRFDSDLDLLVAVRPGTSLFDLAAMTEEIEVLLGVQVDIVSEGGLKARDREILDEAVPL
jgi:predicted nucleotidyltransferase